MQLYAVKGFCPSKPVRGNYPPILTLIPTLTRTLTLFLALALTLIPTLTLTLSLILALAIIRTPTQTLALALALALTLTCQLNGGAP